MSPDELKKEACAIAKLESDDSLYSAEEKITWFGDENAQQPCAAP